MRTETKTFTIVAGFLVGFAVSYAVWHQVDRGTVDRSGVIMLGGSGMLLAMIGLYTAVIAGRIEPRPEDRPDAEISERAGEVGFFSPVATGRSGWGPRRRPPGWAWPCGNGG